MTTTEPVIASDIERNKSYDLFNVVTSEKDFVAASDIAEPFRLRIVAIEGNGPTLSAVAFD